MGSSIRRGGIALLFCQLLLANPLIAETQTLFRLTGSNTIGAELAPLLVKGYLQHLGAENIRQRSEGERHWISAQLKGRAVEVPVVALGSSTGFKALNSDSADIGMASRRIKQSEVEMLARFGDLAGAGAEHVIGLDALVVAVHPDNPVSQLSIAQLRKIYRGEIRNWRELGGADLPVRPLHRDTESGTRATFDEEVFGGSHPAAGVYEVSGNAETHQIVLQQAGAIGYLPYADAGDVKKLAIKAGKLAAVVPDPGIIATEDFPLTRRLYLYKNPSRHRPRVDDFLHFTESPAGQRLVAESGFIDLTPVALKIPPYPNAPNAYRELMASGERLSISFRFADSSSELDSRALKDLRRLQTFMEEHANRELSLTLVGFSDQKANSTIADIISRFRALKVQGALLREHQFGDSRVLALGAFAPLTADSQRAPVKNSRVEVWIN
ncbi:phosphate ABC transporter substrate-binding protein [Microbulbifer rhizosphaerae]|uniref:Phosphate transport system substrate-binding protein n=1 Tax=Microbulbifer rhizosphaerae TaxID=1562603 RepID=A0A7W4W7V2_9GAMM|nr:phosphate ABC transporter substrate-binding protein [Microbulbifer rhizosphaerae]MBB3059312.1 phosphate transport system substrate-binding protein [Microbulbifer rhizosphaerae]